MDVAEDDAGIERSIDGRVNPLLGIIIHQRRRLSVVGIQSGSERGKMFLKGEVRLKKGYLKQDRAGSLVATKQTALTHRFAVHATNRSLREFMPVVSSFALLNLINSSTLSQDSTSRREQ